MKIVALNATSVYKYRIKDGLLVEVEVQEKIEKAVVLNNRLSQMNL